MGHGLAVVNGLRTTADAPYCMSDTHRLGNETGWSIRLVDLPPVQLPNRPCRVFPAIGRRYTEVLWLVRRSGRDVYAWCHAVLSSGVHHRQTTFGLPGWYRSGELGRRSVALPSLSFRFRLLNDGVSAARLPNRTANTGRSHVFPDISGMEDRCGAIASCSRFLRLHPECALLLDQARRRQWEWSKPLD
jgi:hypothetical protein